jgi:hypothetical protein
MAASATAIPDRDISVTRISKNLFERGMKGKEWTFVWFERIAKL